MKTLRALRTEVFRMPQHKLAAHIGESQANISRWENGQGDMPARVLLAIRQLARDMRIPFRDAWLFDGPPIKDKDRRAA